MRIVCVDECIVGIVQFVWCEECVNGVPQCCVWVCVCVWEVMSCVCVLCVR